LEKPTKTGKKLSLPLFRGERHEKVALYHFLPVKNRQKVALYHFFVANATKKLIRPRRLKYCPTVIIR
jgi:hypothetical protein